MLFHPRIFEKAFFAYDAASDVHKGVHPTGMCAFILPDTIFRKVYPGIGDRLFNSWVAEHIPFTTRFIKNEKGTLYVSGNFHNREIIRWIIFDKIHIEEDRIDVTFHTASYTGKIPEGQQTFYSVKCVLVLRKSIWGVKRVKTMEVSNVAFETFLNRVFKNL
jgi:hypothetical protein